MNSDFILRIASWNITVWVFPIRTIGLAKPIPYVMLLKE
jgi:hypothetical protein